MGRYLFLWALSTTLVMADANKDKADLDIHLLPQESSGLEGDHLNSGCPENSECDQVMGIQLKRWQNLLKNLQAREKDPKKQAAFIQGHLDLYGVPAEFYTHNKSAHSFKPLYYNSACAEHNPKGKPADKVLRGMSFIKGTKNKNALLWRDQASLEIPVNDQLDLAPLDIAYDDQLKTYLVPLEEEPLFISKDGPVFLREYDGFFYILLVKDSGEWKIGVMDFMTLSSFEEKKRAINCPQKEKAPKLTGPFNLILCKEIWDDAAKKTRPVYLRRGCI